ncbi:MAG: hypothetical protein ABI767_08525 [Rhodanobacter sp.]
MRSTTRYIALGLASVLLAACGQKDKDAPLAFVPADTPYVIANLEVPDDATRKAMLAQADSQLPAQLVQLKDLATRVEKKDPDGARLLRAFAAEFKGGNLEAVAQSDGIDLKGHMALYGLGLAPVARMQLTDPKAFEAFIGRLETAYGKKLEIEKIGEQRYRRYVSAGSGTEGILAVVGKQAVVAMLPADASLALIRQTLGLDRPQKSMQQTDRLAELAKAKGYQNWMIGNVDLTRALPLAISGTDPLIAAMLKAHAEAESARTGEPVANQLKISPSCATDAARIASRVPTISFGFTRLDATHQDARFDIALADDISKAFTGLKVALPGLGGVSSSPFDVGIALPIVELRTFWMAQAEAVAAKPFTCPSLTDLNENFAKLGPAMQKAAIPPFGDMLGLRIVLDSLEPGTGAAMPSFTGRLVLGTSDPTGLLAMGQMMVPALSSLKLKPDGKPLPLPGDMVSMIGQPAWIAMGDKALALGVGAGEQARLTGTLNDPAGDVGQMARIHVDGAMYLTWLQLMEQKVDSFAAATAAIDKGGDSTMDDADNGSTTSTAEAVASSKAQFAAMEARAGRIKSIDSDVRVDAHGVVITSKTVLK